ncbi:RidA family protein [Burkholderia sp. 22PA0106]|uniref:RidA family protein n=1 Tax=Burkholderia sp. 22PA0106 TaxID=3237371 RepID=UPI0039C0878B
MNPTIERFGTTARMSKLVKHAGVAYLCGQTASGVDAPDIASQTREALSRVDALLAEAGSGRARILSALIHLKDMADFAAMNAVWESWLPPCAAPARTTVQASLASPHLLFEITVTASVD